MLCCKRLLHLWSYCGSETFNCEQKLRCQHLWSMIRLMSRIPGGHSRSAGRRPEKRGYQQSTTNGLRAPMLSGCVKPARNSKQLHSVHADNSFTLASGVMYHWRAVPQRQPSLLSMCYCTVQDSSDGNAYFVKVHCPWDVLIRGAALLKLRKRIKLDNVRNQLNYSYSSHWIS